MRYYPRTIRPEQDDGIVRRFLRGRQLWDPPSAYWRSGKSILGIYLTLIEGEASDHWLWSDASGCTHAYTWLIPQEKTWRIQVHPDAWEAAAAHEIACHAEAELARSDRSFGAPEQPQSAAYVRDGQMVSLLSEMGYVQGEAIDLYLIRPLDQAISSPQLTACFSIRSSTGADSLMERASVQYDAFTGLNRPGERIMGLTKRLLSFCHSERWATDLVVQTPEGTLAGFATLVMDPVTRLGEFDPVGIRHAYRRRGLGRALMLAGLERMRAEGMRYAVVRTGTDNHAAIALYRATGFAEADQLYQFVKTG